MSPKVCHRELPCEVPQVVVASVRVKFVHQVEDAEPTHFRSRRVGTSGLEADSDGAKLLDAALANLKIKGLLFKAVPKATVLMIFSSLSWN